MVILTKYFLQCMHAFSPSGELSQESTVMCIAIKMTVVTISDMRMHTLIFRIQIFCSWSFSLAFLILLDCVLLFLRMRPQTRFDCQDAACGGTAAAFFGKNDHIEHM